MKWNTSQGSKMCDSSLIILTIIGTKIFFVIED